MFSGAIGNTIGALSVNSISSDTGTLTLSAANSYTGSTTLGFVSKLSVGNNSALSTGSVVFNGGTLQAASSGIALSNTSYSVSANSTGTIGGTGDNITLNGTVTLYSGSTLSISNTGTTTLGVVNGSAWVTGTITGLSSAGAITFGGVVGATALNSISITGATISYTSCCYHDGCANVYGGDNVRCCIDIHGW